MVSKATQPDRDAYSALRRAGVHRIFVGGLATDYCVRATGLDARAVGLEVVVLRDAVCAVNVQPGDGAASLSGLAAAGADLATTEEVLVAMESSP